ncbi:MAG TPA: dTMP kinase [Candidatus Margulisiibacteriota bacterium]|nr:dTMP kinase [Candidatus Margulisiibacteriota bacterium]
MAERGCLIAFEGIEGAGKSTQLRLAAAALRERGLTVVETREPGGTTIGVELRHIVMHLPDVAPAPLTELLLYLADRAQHLAEVIVPAIARGAVVLTDRFSASTIAYQGFARQLDLDTVSRLDAMVRGGVAPACTILLDCPVAVGLQRARGADRFHRESSEFHERVRRAFLSLAEADADRYCVLDSTAPTEQIHPQVMAAILRCLRSR